MREEELSHSFTDLTGRVGAQKKKDAVRSCKSLQEVKGSEKWAVWALGIENLSISLPISPGIGVRKTKG